MWYAKPAAHTKQDAALGAGEGCALTPDAHAPCARACMPKHATWDKR